MSLLIVHVLVTGALLSAAAFLLERALGLLGRPVRWVWLGALLGSTLLPLLIWTGVWRGWGWLAEGPARVLLEPAGVIRLEPLLVGFSKATPPWWAGVEPMVASFGALVWGLMSLALMGLVLRLTWRLRQERRAWRWGVVDDVAVLLSRDRGPAVVGLLRPSVVVPDWMSGLEPEARRLILAHEEAHRRAGDPRLLAAGLLSVVLLPWSPFLWWQFLRLRTAVELDCDARVLQSTGAPVNAYGRLLLEVGGRSRGHLLPLPALTESPSTLVRRIRTMTRPQPTHPVLRALPLLGAGILLLAWACDAPDPGAQVAGPPAVQEPAASWTEVVEGPAFTPFTARPEITNMSELQAALESEYPPLLRDAGVGGRVTVWFLIDEQGKVRDTRVNESSGHAALDAAALRVAQAFQWTPGMNRDEPVPVWIALPITFQPPTAAESEGAPLRE